ncbi:MAG: MBL fold metallo-hydrolase [Thermodesulfobacteriota bacterium]
MKKSNDGAAAAFLDLGGIKVYSLSDGTVRLDGGAMFGVVPRVLWEKTNPPDEKNRVLLGINPLLIQTDGKNILVETGMGERWDDKGRAMYSIDRSETLEGSLADLGLSFKDVDIVINTHLHFDHAGGNTVEGASGGLTPAFPRARYIVQEGELQCAMEPGERSRASYRPGDFSPVREAGLFDLIDGSKDETEVVSGVFLFRTSGHNRHIQLVRIEGDNKNALFLSDIIPTAAHINYPYIAAYDLFPLDTLTVKKELISEAAANGWFLFFYHDPLVRCATVRIGERGRPQILKVF